jgi:hypothetical protein
MVVLSRIHAASFKERSEKNLSHPVDWPKPEVF